MIYRNYLPAYVPTRVADPDGFQVDPLTMAPADVQDAEGAEASEEAREEMIDEALADMFGIGGNEGADPREIEDDEDGAENEDADGDDGC